MTITTKQIDEYKQQLEPLKSSKGPLLPALHKAQEIFGYVPLEIQEVLSEELKISNAHINGVLSFYELFHRVPTGKHFIGVCTGTVCHIEQSQSIKKALEDILHIKEGETTTDKRFTMIPVKCLGMCDTSPNLRIDDDMYSHVDSVQLKKILDKYK